MVVERSLLGRLGGVRIDFRSSPWAGARFAISPLYQTGTSCC